MARRLLVLAACCGGKSSLHRLLEGELPVVESDDAVMRAAGGTWPTSTAELRRLVVATGAQALARDDVVHLTSFLPTELIESARAEGVLVAVIDVPRGELERRNRNRVAAGDNDMAHWFDEQLPRFAALDRVGLVDVHLDGTRPLDELADDIRNLVRGGPQT